MRQRLAAVLVSALLLLVTAGCDEGFSIRIGPSAGDRPEQPAAATLAAATPVGEQRTVPLKVVQGPFVFALDTGASQTLIDRDLVDQLKLEITGSAGQVSGVAAKTSAEHVRVTRWRIGEVTLEETTAVTLDLPDPEEGVQLQGLLSSDILSSFGALTVDYERQVLVLRPRR